MDVYYGFTKKGNSFVYVPFHLAAISTDIVHYRWRTDLRFLERLNDSLNLRGDELESKIPKDWVITRVDVNDKILRNFREILYSGNGAKLEEQVYEICDDIAILAETSYDHEHTDWAQVEQDYYEEEESREEHWWSRGDEPPCFSDE